MYFDVIIVGAGLSGSYLARKVKEIGLNTLIIEKSKGIGGRFSTKPVGRGIADYGCQYLKPKTKELSELIQSLKNKNLIKKSNVLQDDEAFIAPYGMNKIPQYLSLGVSTLLNQKVSSIKKTSNQWEIKTNSFILKSKMLVLTMPINQVSELLKVSDLAIPDLPTATYKSFYTITFQNMDAISSKPVLRNDFASKDHAGACYSAQVPSLDRSLVRLACSVARALGRSVNRSVDVSAARLSLQRLVARSIDPLVGRSPFDSLVRSIACLLTQSLVRSLVWC